MGVSDVPALVDAGRWDELLSIGPSAIPLLVEIWQSGKDARQGIPRTLYKLGWVPSEMDKRIAFYLEIEEWEELDNIDPSGIPVLKKELIARLESIGMPANVKEVGKYNIISDQLNRLGDPRGEYIYEAHFVDQGRWVDDLVEYNRTSDGGTWVNEPKWEENVVFDSATLIKRNNSATPGKDPSMLQETSSALAKNVPDAAMMNELLEWVAGHPNLAAGTILVSAAVGSIISLVSRLWSEDRREKMTWISMKASGFFGGLFVTVPAILLATAVDTDMAWPMESFFDPQRLALIKPYIETITISLLDLTALTGSFFFVNEVIDQYWSKFDKAMMEAPEESSSALVGNADPAMINEVVQWVQNNPGWTIAGVVASLTGATLMARNWWLNNTINGNKRRFASFSSRSTAIRFFASKGDVGKNLLVQLRQGAERDKKLAQVLYQLGWSPDGLDKKVTFYSVIEQWNELLKLGTDESSQAADSIVWAERNKIYIAGLERELAVAQKEHNYTAYNKISDFLHMRGLASGDHIYVYYPEINHWGDPVPYGSTGDGNYSQDVIVDREAEYKLERRNGPQWNGPVPERYADAGESKDLGGIDIQNIDVNKTGNARIKFNDDVLRPVLTGGFDGFTPVFIKMTPVDNPLMILGVAGPAGEEVKA